MSSRRPVRTRRSIGAALERVVQGITTFPDEFHVHPKLEGFLKKRQEILRGAPIDWATAEIAGVRHAGRWSARRSG